ncbi:hypothetical protein QFC22_005266 [Naganishia vaughanmartiniae]|uniref:Uncharacterized protein n=1 Tax=Naganishia vaughanmartiniae TaxID=1424756 RepID=A0ACC2WUP0_9TREE|nr:hypothetical protein QFC22_005266 [Naganishia vaughanmartiniae]
MVETSIEQQEPEPDIRSLSLRINNPPPDQHQTTAPAFTNSDTAAHDDGIHKPRLNPSPPSVIKEKDFYVPVRPAVLDPDGGLNDEQLEPALPALTRLRRPFVKEKESENISPILATPARSSSTPAYSRSRHHHQHVVDFPNVPRNKDAPSAFATAIPPPPQRLTDLGPPRPPKNIAELFAPDRKLGGDPGWTQSFVNTVKCSYFNLMIFLVPVAWALHFTKQNDVVVFVFTFLSVIPLANLLSFATEQLALRTGEAIGGLLNASFGNAVELLISILALVKGDIALVQASMIGSILSNTLLVLGMCYFAGGLRFHEQLYAVASSQLQISLLGISIAAIILPAAYHFATNAGANTADITDLTHGEENHLLSISRGLAFLLLSVYAMYLVFILYTHAYLFKLPRPGRPHLSRKAAEPQPNHQKVFPKPNWLSSIQSRSSNSSIDDDQAREERDNALTPVMTREPVDQTASPDAMHSRDVERGADSYHHSSASASATLPADHHLDLSEISVDDDNEEEETPKVKALFALCLLLGVTAITGVTAEFLIDSVNGLTETTSISKEFVGLILFPLVGNATEHVAAVTVSVKDKLNLSMAIAIGSSIQISLFILPLLVLIGWMIGQPMSLFFDVFETITLTISLLLVNFAISDGRTNYLEGYVLMIS